MTPWHRLAPLLALGLIAASPAHEWNSPVPPSDPAPWSGRLWAGPAQGAPEAPSATDCRRPPQWLDLPGPVGSRQTLGAAPEVPPGTLPDRRERRESAVAGALRSEAAPARLMKPSPAPPPSPSTEAMVDADAPGPDRAQGQDAAPVTAGLVDDNADFGAYLAFRQRHTGLNVRDLDIGERYRLSVQDDQGRPVADAEVRLFAAGQGKALPQPLWARTDAGGQAWLHPRAAGLQGAVFEVQVRAGDRRGSALLRRGQRDALQVTLNGDVAPTPARLDLVFLVDATGSMADEIDKLRRSMQAMATQIGTLPSRPSICWGLVAYRDRGDAFFVRAQDFTDDLDAFQQQLAGLRADGGGDTPEALNEALHTAVHRLSWRGDGATRLVLLVADAPPHLDYGSPWYDDDVQGALARGIKLFGIAASGLDRGGEFIFRQLAQFTGGRFVFLTYADARRPSSGPGRETVHDVDGYSVQTLDTLVVRLVREELARRPSA